MAQSVRQLDLKIQGTKHTRVITQAMYAISMAKLSKLNNGLKNARQIYERLKKLKSSLGESVEQPESPNYIVVSTDRGLCGALNNHLFKKIGKSDIESSEFITIGKKALGWLQSKDAQVRTSITNLSIDTIDSVAQEVAESLFASKAQWVILHNKYINALRYDPSKTQVSTEADLDLLDDQEAYIIDTRDLSQFGSDFTYFMAIAMLKVIIYENHICEQAARMVAMKNATENADEVVQTLQQLANQIRQAQVTREVSEITAGIAALK